MTPLQIWLPLFGSSLSIPAHERDAQRAFETWRGEMTVWLLPDIKTPARWREDSAGYVASVPSETLNRIEIYHCGRNGHVIGPSLNVFRECTVDGLLEEWLNCTELDICSTPEKLRLAVPRLVEHQVGYEEIDLAFEAGPMIPITKFDEDKAEFSAGWPPHSASYRTVSPEGESQVANGPLEPTHTGKSPIVRSSKTGVDSIHCVFRWPEPIRNLVPLSASWDVALGQQRMREIAETSSNDPARALSLARENARGFVSEGTTSREWEWFLPTIDKGGTKAVVFQAEYFGITAKGWPDLRDRDEFKALLAQSVPIRRVWGSLGLFWALLLEQLEDHRQFLACQKCGRLIGGKKGKTFCGREDSVQCFLNRRASDKRKQRAT